MDIGAMLKMMSGGKSNPALDQLLAVSVMLGKLSKEEQTRIITDFVNELQEAVDKVEGKSKNDETKA